MHFIDTKIIRMGTAMMKPKKKTIESYGFDMRNAIN